MSQSLRGLSGEDHHADLHKEDGDGLGGEEPLEVAEEDQDEEHAETDGVVHHRRPLQRADADGGGLHGLLLRVGEGGEDLRGVADEGREDEGDVEVGDAQSRAHVVQHVHDGVREEDHHQRARQHHAEAAQDDASLLLLRREMHQVRGDLLLVLVVVLLHRHRLQLALGAQVHQMHDEVAELVEVELLVLVVVERLQHLAHLRHLHRLAQVAQQVAQLHDVHRSAAVLVVAVEERTHQDPNVVHQLRRLLQQGATTLRSLGATVHLRVTDHKKSHVDFVRNNRGNVDETVLNRLLDFLLDHLLRHLESTCTSTHTTFSVECLY